MTDIAETLLPCPFCGGEAEIERHGTARQSMIVACQHCGARMESGDVSGLTRDLAWNRRAAQAERMARLEREISRLRKALDEKVPIYHPRRRRAEVRFAVSWLMYFARQMNDPHARQVLYLAADRLGTEGEAVPARAKEQETR